MISLDRLVEAAAAERSLLVAFSASPSHLETGILRSLQQRGEGRVTVLVDHSQHWAAFSERGVRAPGVHYRYFPVRLPKRAAAFHAKLYLLSKSDSATLIVSSANLSRAGWRRNAEVADRLTITKEDGGDVRAFVSYVQFLEQLAGSSLELHEAARGAVRREATLLREMLGDHQRDEGPWFLHNLERPLLTQLRQLVPANAVREITIVSPYFDRENAALRAFADAFPNAPAISVIKNREDHNFAGDKVAAAMKGRLRLFYSKGMAEKKRYVHAKCVLLSGPSGDWVIAGSANLTAPAWLRAATSNEASGLGNLEAMTVRHFPDGGAASLITRPLKPLDEEKRWFALKYEAPAPMEPGTEVPDAVLDAPLVDAELTGSSLFIRIQGLKPVLGKCVVSCVVESSGGDGPSRFERSAGAVLSPDGSTEIEIPIGTHMLVDQREPAIVTVEVTLPSGEKAIGHAWLMRTTLIDTPAPERAFEYAVEDFTRRPFHGGDQYEALLAGLLDVLVADVVHHGSDEGKDAGGQRTPTPDGEEDAKASGGSTKEHRGQPVSPDTLIIDESDPRVWLGSMSRSSTSLLARVHQAMAQLFAQPEDDQSDDDESELEGARNTRRRTEHSTAPGSRIPRLKPTEVHRANELLAEISSHLRNVLKPNNPQVRVRQVAKGLFLFEKLVEAVLPSLYLQAREAPPETLAELRTIVTSIWHDAWSLDGAEYGDIRGWIVRSSLDPHCVPVLASTASPEWWGRVLASLAASLLMLERTATDRASNSTSVASIIAGMRFVSTEDDLAGSAAWGVGLNERIAAYAARSDGLVSEADARGALERADALDWEFNQLVAKWGPVSEYCVALLNGTRFDISKALRVAPELRESLEKLQRRFPLDPAVPVSFEGDHAICGGCSQSLSRQRTSQLRSPNADPCKCESCGRLLLPIAFTSSQTQAVLARFGRPENGQPDLLADNDAAMDGVGRPLD